MYPVIGYTDKMSITFLLSLKKTVGFAEKRLGKYIVFFGFLIRSTHVNVHKLKSKGIYVSRVEHFFQKDKEVKKDRLYHLSQLT